MADDLITALQGKPPRDKRTRCYYAEWFKKQTPEFQEVMSAAMAVDSRWRAVDLFNLVKEKAGYERQYNTLRMHRAGECTCGR